MKKLIAFLWAELNNAPILPEYINNDELSSLPFKEQCLYVVEVFQKIAERRNIKLKLTRRNDFQIRSCNKDYLYNEWRYTFGNSRIKISIYSK